MDNPLRYSLLELEHLAAIIESSGDAIISIDLDGTITSWNPAAENIFGYSEAEAIGRNISMIVPPDLQKEGLEIISQVKQGQKIDHVETIRIGRNGQRINISLTASPLRNDKGEIIGASKIAKDITALRDAELKKAMLSNIIESSDDAIISKDLDGVVTSWNPAAEKIFGYTAAEVVGKSITIIIPPEYLHEEPVILSQVKAGQKIDHYQTVRMRKDGQRVHVSLSISPIKDSRGNIVGVSKVARNITEVRQAEINNAMLAAIVRSSDDAIVSKNLLGIITSWNPGAEKIFGYTEKEAIGQSIYLIIPPDRRSEEEGIISKIRKGERVDHFETQRMTKSGKLIDISVTVSPIKDANGKIVGASKVARDITTLKELERKKDEFISVASHELKTPLTSLKAYMQLLERTSSEQQPDSKLHGYIQKAFGFTMKLEGLVSELLDITKISSGKLQMIPEWFSFETLLDDTIEIISHQAPGHTITKQGDAKVRVYADRHRIEQVLINYLSNAIKYSPHADKVIITVTNATDHLKVAVKDFGIGIPREKLPRIFERFYRATEENKQFQGLGIGLYISSEIIKRHNGHIWVESEEGKGSTFYFTLPL